MEVFVGDVTTHILHNLQPGTTYDVKVYAQYDAGVSGALIGQGTTRTCWEIIWMSRESFDDVNRVVCFSVSQRDRPPDIQCGLRLILH